MEILVNEKHYTCPVASINDVCWVRFDRFIIMLKSSLEISPSVSYISQLFLIICLNIEQAKRFNYNCCKFNVRGILFILNSDPSEQNIVLNQLNQNRSVMLFITRSLKLENAKIKLFRYKVCDKMLFYRK